METGLEVNYRIGIHQTNLLKGDEMLSMEIQMLN